MAVSFKIRVLGNDYGVLYFLFINILLDKNPYFISMTAFVYSHLSFNTAIKTKSEQNRFINPFPNNIHLKNPKFFEN